MKKIFLIVTILLTISPLTSKANSLNTYDDLLNASYDIAKLEDPADKIWNSKHLL
jgi:ABC-type sulfate transport system substrate-binding protein